MTMASNLTIGCESVIIFSFHPVKILEDQYFKIFCFYLVYFSVVMGKIVQTQNNFELRSLKTHLEKTFIISIDKVRLMYSQIMVLGLYRLFPVDFEERSDDT